MTKRLFCRECQREFMFSNEEREFLLSKGLQHEPKSCGDCRLVLRNWRKAVAGEALIPISEVACAQCGVPTKVPFEPMGHRPIYCKGCFHGRKAPRRHEASDQPDAGRTS